MSALDKKGYEKMCQEIADTINEQLKDMTDQEAENYLDTLSESFFRMGDNREDH